MIYVNKGKDSREMGKRGVGELSKGACEGGTGGISEGAELHVLGKIKTRGGGNI